MEYLHTGLEIAGAVLLIATPLARGLEGAADAFHSYAASTPSESDDAVADRLVSVAGFIADGLDKIASLLPVLRMGSGR